MAYEQRDMSGSMFKNKDKEDGDSRPNVKGECLIEGVAYWMDSWTKKDKNGNPWQSVSFKRKDTQRAKTAPTERQRQVPEAAFDDSTPF